MSTLRTAAQVAGVFAATVAVGTAYVLIHEHRRRNKKDKKRVGDAGSSSQDRGLSVERLIEVLGESANAAYQLIEQVRKAPHVTRRRRAHRPMARLLFFSARSVASLFLFAGG